MAASVWTVFAFVVLVAIFCACTIAVAIAIRLLEGVLAARGRRSNARQAPG